MNYKKIIVTLLITGFGALLVSLFWEKPALLSLLLTFIGFIKHKILPIKKEFLFFIIAGFLGTATESFIMLAGPWSYASSFFINFPLWLPFLWGLAGILGISLYQGFTEKK